jgi:hypothetical protein
VTFLVGPFVEAERVFAIGQAGNNGLRPSVCEPVTQLRAVVSLVREQPFRGRGSANQAFRYGAIMCLTAGQEDGKKTAFSICECVDLRIAPAA